MQAKEVSVVSMSAMTPLSTCSSRQETQPVELSRRRAAKPRGNLQAQPAGGRLERDVGQALHSANSPSSRGREVRAWVEAQAEREETWVEAPPGR